MNLTGRPIAPKPEKVRPDPKYLDAVRLLPCVCCGKQPVEAHHCRDKPFDNERGLYQRVPGARLKSGDRDAIPLCKYHHDMFHLHRAKFHAEYGKDYGFIGTTRAAIEHAEVDF